MTIMMQLPLGLGKQIFKDPTSLFFYGSFYVDTDGQQHQCLSHCPSGHVSVVLHLPLQYWG